MKDILTHHIVLLNEAPAVSMQALSPTSSARSIQVYYDFVRKGYVLDVWDPDAAQGIGCMKEVCFVSGLEYP